MVCVCPAKPRGKVLHAVAKPARIHGGAGYHCCADVPTQRSQDMSTITHSRSHCARWIAVGAAVVSLAVLGGCANRSASSGVYSYDQAQREQIVRTGTVTGVRPITIQEDKTSGGGVLAGGALGGVAGNAVGGGSGRAIATVGGAILGALAGNMIENRAGRSSG